MAQFDAFPTAQRDLRCRKCVICLRPPIGTLKTIRPYLQLWPAGENRTYSHVGFATGLMEQAFAENASLFGQPAEYIIQQATEFKNGLRNNSTSRVATDLMIKLSKAVRDDELKEAAAYFAAINPDQISGS
jgi:hypothetical protein